MAKRKGLTDEAARDEMVVLLEGMPEEDIDATLSEDDDSLTITEAMSSASPMGDDEFMVEVQGMVDNWDPKTAEGKKYHDELKASHKKEKKKQGYDDTEDESMGMRDGAEDTKSQSEAARRYESYGDYGSRS